MPYYYQTHKAMDAILTLEEYSGKVNITVDKLKGKSRKVEYTIPRFVYWFYLNKADPDKWRVSKIAAAFERERKAIRNGIKQINNFIDTNDLIIQPYREEFIDPFLHEVQSN